MLATLFLLLAPAQQGPDPVPVETTMDQVTVYAGQALVERTFTVSADQPGPQAALVGPLPVSAGEDSFQARVEDGGVVLQGLEVRQRTGQLDEGERDRLRQRLEDLREAVRDLEPERAAIRAGRSMVDSVVRSMGEGGLEGFQGMELPALIEFVSQQSQTLNERDLVLTRREENLRAQIDDLQKQLGGNARAVRPYQQVVVRLFFERPGTATVRLIYLAQGASWRPVYDVRMAIDLQSVDVGLIGQVRQNTDEDWEEARVLLSTAQPQIGLDPPEVPQRWVRARQSLAKRERGMLQALGYAGGADSAPAASAAPAEESERAFAPAPTVTVQDFGLTQQFELPTRVTIPSGTEPRQFRLVQVPLDVRPERYVIPSLSETCYLRAEVTSEEAAPLLPGVARIFLGPDYLGEASFPMLRQGDSTMLNLGTDPNLVVTDEVVIDERDDPSLFSKVMRRTRVHEVTLKLSAAAHGPVEVFIEEVLPVSQDDRIKITPTQMADGALEGKDDLEARKERGIWRWRFTMRPGQERSMRWGYVMAYNEDLNPVIDGVRD